MLLRNTFYLLIIALLSSCGTIYKEAPIVTKNSRVNKYKSAIIVMRIRWVEEFIQPNYSVYQRTNQSLMEEKSDLINHYLSSNDSDLKSPLHYIFNIQLLFKQNHAHDESKNQGLMVERFDKDLRKYDEIAIHTFGSGEYTLNGLRFDYGKFGVNLNKNFNNNVSNWKRYTKRVFRDFYSWDIHYGSIYYIGDFTLHFRTKKFFISSSTDPLNESVDLTRITMRDNYANMLIDLGNKTPWLPTHSIINLSNNLTWNLEEKSQAEKNQRTPSPQNQNTDHLFF